MSWGPWILQEFIFIIYVKKVVFFCLECRKEEGFYLAMLMILGLNWFSHIFLMQIGISLGYYCVWEKEGQLVELWVFWDVPVSPKMQGTTCGHLQIKFCVRSFRDNISKLLLLFMSYLFLCAFINHFFVSYLFQVLAWFPRTFAQDFMDLLPTMLSQESAVEVSTNIGPRHTIYCMINHRNNQYYMYAFLSETEQKTKKFLWMSYF